MFINKYKLLIEILVIYIDINKTFNINSSLLSVSFIKI